MRHVGIVRVVGLVGLLGLTVAVPRSSASAELLTTYAPKGEPLTIGKLSATLDDPLGTLDDLFGDAVAQSGMNLIVGARGTSNDDGNDGAAYIYTKGSAGWPKKPTVSLASPGGCGGCDFGNSVAISGNTAIVGAIGYDTYTGKAYIYVKGPSGWPSKPTVTLVNPNPSPQELFGSSVAVSADTAIVGASGSGSAYLYTKEASGWPSKPTAALTVANGPSDEFGYSVSIYGDTAIVGAPETTVTNAYAGKAYLYVRGATGWPTGPTKTLLDPDGSKFDQFGFSVAISTKTVFVGAIGPNKNAGAVYIYSGGSSGWSSKPTTTLPDPGATSYDQFGYTLALSGKVAVIGETGENEAYVFDEGSSGWRKTPTVTLTDPGMSSNDDFGNEVAASANDAVVGAAEGDNYDGVAYIFVAGPSSK
jgi:hypothetical protein